jgi:osmotically-inducible protein OsmY
MKKSDSEIKQAVLQELRWDTRVSETDVGVLVDGGTVTLTGAVDSWAKRLAAEQAAHRVVGVLDVANDVQVKTPEGAKHTDTAIAHAVRHSLEWDVFVPDQRVRSTVSNGWVTLEGEVDFWSQRIDTERAVSYLAGVKGITNRLLVKPSRAISVDVKRAIEEALKRRSEREAERIQIEVEDGTAKVSGAVHSWLERAVLGATRGTPGVRTIEENLRIEP